MLLSILCMLLRTKIHTQGLLRDFTRTSPHIQRNE